jgi:hypothetical protein
MKGASQPQFQFHVIAIPRQGLTKLLFSLDSSTESQQRLCQMLSQRHVIGRMSQRVPQSAHTIVTGHDDSLLNGRPR